MIIKSTIISAVISTGLLSVGACTLTDTPAQSSISYDASEAPTRNPIIGATGETIGEVVLLQAPTGVLGRIRLDPGALSPGWHGLHLHQIGNCEDVGTFTNSGGHIGKIEGGHGLINPAGPEAGDLPNVHVGTDGSAEMEFFSDRFTITQLRDDDNAALIIHAGRDDHISQPIGGAGARVACAVVQ